MAKKPPTVAATKKKAWAVFSKFIRVNAADSDGNCTCITCGRVYPWQKIQAGHWIPGRTNAVLFMEDAVHPQCYGCNVRKQSNPIRYWLWMEANIGRPRMDQMIAVMDDKKEYDLDDYLQFEREFTYRLKKVAGEKGIDLKAKIVKKDIDTSELDD